MHGFAAELSLVICLALTVHFGAFFGSRGVESVGGSRLFLAEKDSVFIDHRLAI